jgi:hypothetical protein
VQLTGGGETFTDGTGFYAFCRVAPGAAEVRTAGGAQTVNVRAGEMRQVDLALH